MTAKSTLGNYVPPAEKAEPDARPVRLTARAIFGVDTVDDVAKRLDHIARFAVRAGFDRDDLDNDAELELPADLRGGICDGIASIIMVHVQIERRKDAARKSGTPTTKANDGPPMVDCGIWKTAREYGIGAS